MKRMSHIAKELRDQGCMFSQTKFMNDLVNYEPVFKEGKVAFYPDNITDDMMHLYKKRKPKAFELAAATVMQNEVDERECTRQERIEMMLENISGYLDQLFQRKIET